MVRCRGCRKEMKEVGFKWHNRRYECYHCGIRYVSFMERYFGINFLGFPKWSNLSGEKNE